MKHSRIFMRIIEKFGYIGTGMFLAGLIEFGPSRWTVGGLLLAILVTLVGYLMQDEAIRLDEEDDETI